MVHSSHTLLLAPSLALTRPCSSARSDSSRFRALAGARYLLLAECEHRFLKVIADLPVRQRAALPPAAVKALQGTLIAARSAAMAAAVAEGLQQACYQAWIGFYSKQFTTLQVVYVLTGMTPA